MAAIPNYKTMAIIATPLVTSGIYQFACWYRDDGELVIGRITRGTHRWGVNHQQYVFAGVARTALNLPVGPDDHNFPAIFVDALGRIHVWANMHIETLKYVRTSAAHTTDGWLATAGWVDASSELPGVEVRCTYPTPVRQTDGSLFFYMRNDDIDSVSGASDSQCWTMSTSGTWSSRTTLFQGISVPDAGGPGIPGSPTSVRDITNWSAYPTNWLVESTRTANPGRMHVSWVWRHSGTGQLPDGSFPDAFENILPSYAYSDDKGATWKGIDGTTLTVPIHPLNSLAARIPTGGALVRSSSRTSNVVTAELDTSNHGLTVGRSITAVIQTGSMTSQGLTVASVGSPTANHITWTHAGPDVASGGVGHVTAIRYHNWGGVDVDNLGLPHIVGSISPTRYFRRNSTNTDWVESTVTNPLNGIQQTSRGMGIYLRGNIWVLAESVSAAGMPDYSRRVRLYRGTTTGGPAVTMSGEVGNSQWDPGYDPEAYRRFGIVEHLAPDGNVPRVFSFPRGLPVRAA